MKKIFTIALLALFATSVSAQIQQKKIPRHYINFAYAMQDIKAENGDKLDGYQWGAAAEFGSTFFLHKSPIVGMLRIGLDFSYLDLQYAQYKNNLVIEGETQTLNTHFANIGMQVGPSLTVSPFPKLNFKGYVHYAPSFAAFSNEDWKEVFGGYAGYVTAGVSASYSAITVGFEVRGGKSVFHSVKTDEESLNAGTFLDGEKQKFSLPSTRLIVGFRF